MKILMSGALCYPWPEEMTHDEIIAAKRTLRRRMLENLRAMPARERVEGSLSLMDRLLGSELWTQAEAIYSYLSLELEVDTHRAHTAALAGGKRLALPRIEGDELDFRFVEELAGPWEAGALGIREPSTALPAASWTPGGAVLVLVPGLAFDGAGGRLGRGKGFYDRFLARSGAPATVGLCFSVQLVDEVPREQNDHRVGWLATETALFKTASRP